MPTDSTPSETTSGLAVPAVATEADLPADADSTGNANEDSASAE